MHQHKFDLVNAAVANAGTSISFHPSLLAPPFEQLIVILTRPPLFERRPNLSIQLRIQKAVIRIELAERMLREKHVGRRAVRRVPIREVSSWSTPFFLLG